MKKITDWFMGVINTVNTTNLRLVVTVLLWFATGVLMDIYFVLTGNWKAPPLEWVAALTTMSGIDAIQYFSKRKTHKKFADDEPANGG